VEEGGGLVKHFDRYEAFNIVWDTSDCEGDVPNLPVSLIVECANEGDAEDVICEHLSDSMGFCVRSFEYRKIVLLKNYVIHFKQTIDGIETDTSRYWTCKAEDYGHAIEQLNAEVCGSQGEKIFFHELQRVSF
jgi:hypothetical protein